MPKKLKKVQKIEIINFFKFSPAPQVTTTITLTRTVFAIAPTSIYTVYDVQTVTATTTQLTIIPTTVTQPPSTITVTSTPPLPTVYSTVTSISVVNIEPARTVLPSTVTRYVSKPFHHFNHYSHRKNADLVDKDRTVALPSVFEQFLKKERETRVGE